MLTAFVEANIFEMHLILAEKMQFLLLHSEAETVSEGLLQ